MPRDEITTMTTTKQSACPGFKVTPTAIALLSKKKPRLLMGLGEDNGDKFALIEFDDCTAEKVYITSLHNAWHPILCDLDYGPGMQDDLELATPANTIRMHFGERERVKQRGGSFTVSGFPSFTTHSYTRQGRHTGTNWFDVPAEDLLAGTTRGINAAKELAEYLGESTFDRNGEALRNILCEAEALASIPFPDNFPHATSRKYAAQAFLDCLTPVLRHNLSTINQAYFDARRVEQQVDVTNFIASCDRLRARERAAFTQRMRAAKEVKRAARARASGAHAVTTVSQLLEHKRRTERAGQPHATTARKVA